MATRTQNFIPGMPVRERWLGVAILGLLLVSYLPVFSLYAQQQWSTAVLQGAYQHAWLALAVLAWLTFRQLRQTPVLKRNDLSPIALGVLSLGVGMKIFGEIQAFDVLRGLSLIPTLTGLVLIRFGPEGWRKLRFHVLFLLLIIPLPASVIEVATRPLMEITAVVARDLLPLLGISVEGTGQILWIGRQDSPLVHELVIAAECSGIRSLVALLALAALFAHIRLYRLSHFATFILMVVPLTIVANLARVMLMATLIVYVSPEAGEAFFHELSGLVLFAVTVAGLLFLDRHWQKKGMQT